MLKKNVSLPPGNFIRAVSFQPSVQSTFNIRSSKILGGPALKTLQTPQLNVNKRSQRQYQISVTVLPHFTVFTIL